MALPAIEEPLGYDRCAGDLASQNNSHGAVTPCDVTVAHSLQLFKGWRPTMLGSSWIELAICAQGGRSGALTAGVLFVWACSSSSDSSSGTSAAAAATLSSVLYSTLTNSTAAAAAVTNSTSSAATTVAAAAAAAATAVAHAGTQHWYRWGRALTPFIFITNRTYLKVFLRGLIRVLPRLLPVLLLT
eukprot:12048-Heterococcus_DN1.PRE.1